LRLFLVLAILSWRSVAALQVMPSICQQEEAKVQWKKRWRMSSFTWSSQSKQWSLAPTE
jgi:hypothetical protein